jgi:putative ABC transport system permease protein
VHRLIVERLSTLPGVEAAGIGAAPVSYLAPVRGRAAGTSIMIEGGRRYLNGEPNDAPFTPGRRYVSSGWIEAFGLRLVRGRTFTETDVAGAPWVAVINETMAQIHWPGQDAIGKRVNFEWSRRDRSPLEPWTTIVGVVADARQHRFEESPRPEIYTPLAQADYVASWSTVLVRSAVPPETLTAPVREAVRAIDPRVPAYDIRTMTSIIREATATQRYSAWLVGLFALIAMSLTAVGIHGLGAFAAAQRTREIGIRVALGATRGDILRLTVGDGIRPSIYGLAVGIVAAMAGTGLLRGLLYEVEPSDPRLFAGALLTLACVAFVAAYRPARRAARVDPMVALRE